jgi:hypothetical protein
MFNSLSPARQPLRLVALPAAAATIFFLCVCQAAAAPPSQLSILRACGDADTAAQCERVVEAEQIRQFAEFASRDGPVLRLKTRSGQPVVLRDQGVPGTDEGPGSRFYALWDYWFVPRTAIVSVSAPAGDHYLIVDLNRGTQTRISAEPLLSPDSMRFVVVDLCDTQCGNTIELWRFDRDRLVRERTFKPPEKWYESEVKWKDATLLEIEYSVAARGQPPVAAAADLPPGPPVLVRSDRSFFLRITDRAWTINEAAR